MELILYLAFTLGGPLLLALSVLAFAQTPRRARLTVGLHGLRWRLRAGHLAGWATAPALFAVVGALAWLEVLIRWFFADDPFMCGQGPGFPECEPVWASSSLTTAALLACVLAWPSLRTGLRRHPAEVRVETEAVHLGATRVSWTDIAGVRVERRGWPIRYKTLVLEADPPVRIAVDRERDDTLDRVLAYLNAANHAPEIAAEVHPVPGALEALRVGALPAALPSTK